MHGHAHRDVLAIVAAAITLLTLFPALTAPAPAVAAAPPRPIAPAVSEPAPRPIVAAAARLRLYVVRGAGQGRRPDTLTRIAERYLGDPARWSEIYALNRGALVSADLIRPGDRLRLPADAIGLPVAPPERTYTVRRGDSLWRIAEAELGDPGRWPELHRHNRGTVAEPDLLQPGWVLRLPPVGGL
jgi:nucleoid-associated protein YgaU